MKHTKRATKTAAAKPKALSAISAIRALADTSPLVARALFGSRGGLTTFGGKRDIFNALGYAKILSPEMLRTRYQRNELAGAIVDAYPDATWRGGGELVEDEDPNTETAFEKAFNELNKRLHLWSVFRRADVLAGMGPFSVILIGAPGEFNTPLGKIGPDKLLYLTPFSAEDASVDLLVSKTDDQRFGLPEVYGLKRIAGATNRDRKRQVHWSRILHVARDPLDDEVNGQAILERVWNRLDDLEKVAGSGAEAFWKRVWQGLHLNIDPEIEIKDPEVEDLKKQVDEWEHGLRRVFRTRGVEVGALNSEVSDFKNQIAAIVGLLSAGTRIPQRILLGSERGELASSQDDENWDSRIKARREEWAGPFIVRPFVDRLIAAGVLPKPPKDYEVRWPDMHELSPKERVELANKAADTNSKAGETVVTPDEIRDIYLGLPPLDTLESEGDESDPGEEDLNAGDEPPDPEEDPNANKE